MKIKEIAVILPLGILLVIACTCSSTEPEPTPTPTPEPASDLQILTENLNCYEVTAGPYSWRCELTGTVKNMGDEDAEMIAVRAEFFDTYGEKLSYISDVVGDLHAGEWVNYDIVYTGAQRPVTYEVWASGTEPGGFCFIATAAYGTSTAWEIDTLRAFRDKVLLQNSLGSQSVAFYYEVSPPAATFISEHEPLRTLVRDLLVDPVVWVVEATGTIWQD